MKRGYPFMAGAAALTGLAVLSACDSRPDVDTSRPSHFGFQTSIPASLLAEGQLAYTNHCVGCHGEKGDGLGEAAPFLAPRPRNFVTANFKYSSTRSGQLPTDEDLKRTIRRGLRGSAMPSFKLLPERTLDGLVAYVKTFSPRWKEDDPVMAIPLVDDPYRSVADKSEAVRRGEAVYHSYARCWSCHSAYVPEGKINEYIVAFGGDALDQFRPLLDQSEGKETVEGEMLYPPDFLRDFVRGGMTVDDLYRSIAAGITGTAMPTWVDSIDVPGRHPGDPPLVSRSDLWAMAYYVHDLIVRRPALLREGAFVVRDRAHPVTAPGATPSAHPPAATQPAGTFDF
jgi:mono/diheme cytochrome c family protein